MGLPNGSSQMGLPMNPCKKSPEPVIGIKYLRIIYYYKLETWIKMSIKCVEFTSGMLNSSK